MKMLLLDTAIYVHRPYPVEFHIDVDGRAIRVAIEWPAIERMMGATPVDDERVRDFLHENRRAVAHAIEAHLYAQGMPWTGELVMARDDFDVVRFAPNRSVDTTSFPRTGSGDVLRRAP
jgi:hypothetical protein